MPKIVQIYDNPGLAADCPSAQKFRRGAQRAGVDLSSCGGGSGCFFTWHGTGESSVQPICDSGFDPGKRRGQAYGPSSPKASANT